MASTDSPGHLLSLKVMRVSRPALASAWQPFYSSSPSFSAHSTASILSLQGTSPLPGHPKTLRDLTHASELLTLPASFGAIQLGETFASCVCVHNEAGVEVEGVRVTVEMQTAGGKAVLAELGDGGRLSAGETVEGVVGCEIREVGQHVLACSVAYRVPMRGAAEGEEGVQTFRKFYKFAVTNPLSVKTKVHVPRAPGALVLAKEREKVFLEVHVQNLTLDSMWFENMRFECAEGWRVAEEVESGLFDGATAMMQPQDTRQYIYVLSPSSLSAIPVEYAPGSVVPLGRLDISWRSSFGEAGRLLTSMLSRRVALPPQPIPQQPASALPPYLKRNTTAIPSSPPPRTRSPQIPQSRPSSPPLLQRPASPFQNRIRIDSARPQSPVPVSLPHHAVAPSDIDVNLVVDDIPKDFKAETPFTVEFALTVSAVVEAGQKRIVRLAVQKIQRPKATKLVEESESRPVAGAFSPRLLPSSGFSTPSPTFATFNYALAHEKLLDAVPLHSTHGEGQEERRSRHSVGVVLPPPTSESATLGSSETLFLGASTLFLPPISVESAEGDGGRARATCRFGVAYVPRKGGFCAVGGLRVVLVDEEEEGREGERSGRVDAVKTLGQWDVVGEIWVRS